MLYVPFKKGGDVEAQLYPAQHESPQIRWAFIRKVYAILSIQMLLTVVVASMVVFVRPIALFFVSSTAGLVLYICLIFIPFIVLCPLYYYHQKHPINFILLGIFTIAISFPIGLSCAFTSASSLFLQQGKVILEAAILTCAVVISLTLYTFWAAKRGHDFSFLGPILFCSLIVIIFGFIQILFPLGKVTTMIYGALGAIIFSGYIIYDTNNVIKQHSYDEYIWAAVSLYLDIINLFLALLTLLRAADS